MAADSKAKAIDELARLTETLDRLGVAYEVRDPYYVTFDNANGKCRVWPSQTHDGQLAVQYAAKGHCDTSEEAVGMCFAAQGGDSTKEPYGGGCR